MAYSRELVEAAAEIKRFEQDDDPESLKGLDIDNVKTRHINIDHASLANTLAKFISFVRMNDNSKKVMLYKLSNPGASDSQIGIVMGLRSFDVALYEAEGKKAVSQALASTSLQEAIDKFNSDRTVQNAVKNLKTEDLPGGSLKL